MNSEYVADTTFYNDTKVYNNAIVGVERYSWSRSGTVGVDTAAQAGDLIYRHDIQAYTGTDYKRAVELSVEVPLAPTSGNSYCPGSFEIKTGNATGTALSRALVLNSSQQMFAPGVYATTTAAAANVYVFSSGGLARSTSSIRYKKNVQPMTTKLEAVKQLKPVTFNEKTDDTGKVFAGLIAEDLDEQGLKEYVSYDEEGRPDAIHYGNLVALAFKAIQELEAKVAALEAQVAGA